jgi:hypothetical protein
VIGPRQRGISSQEVADAEESFGLLAIVILKAPAIAVEKIRIGVPQLSVLREAQKELGITPK